MHLKLRHAVKEWRTAEDIYGTSTCSTNWMKWVRCGRQCGAVLCGVE
jgi:hypothetical protein